jgi:3-isopropylmalate/(R)-2-methylmalate dehydratase small subunit
LLFYSFFMKLERKISSIAIKLDMKDIDTDLIIPAKFMKGTTKEGLGNNVFYNLRYKNPDFPMNKPGFSNSEILVVGKNFGCGSSREHAPWALRDAGIKVIISSEFADIFSGNAGKNGILLVVLKEYEVREILDDKKEFLNIEVDIDNQIIKTEQNKVYSFNISSFLKKRLLNGILDSEYILDYSKTIKLFEKERKKHIF